jgi:hypothetical protein
MNKLVFINTLGNILIYILTKSAYDVVLDVVPAVRDESETLELGFLDEVAEFVRVGVIEDELLAFLLDLFSCDGFHVLKLFLAQYDKCDGLD